MKQKIFGWLLVLCLGTGLLTVPAGAATSFSDVPQSHWAYQQVQYVCQEGLMTGTGPGTFGPNQTVSRAMLVTVMGRLAGADLGGKTASRFRDISASAWYAPYVKWAADAGLVTGYSDGTFRPNDAVTREQYSAIAYRYFQWAGRCAAADYRTVRMQDNDKISAYAVPGVFYLTTRGLMDLHGGESFQPKEPLTRAELAVSLSRIHPGLLQGAVRQSITESQAKQQVEAFYNAARTDDGNYVIFDDETRISETWYTFTLRYQMTDQEGEEIFAGGGFPVANRLVCQVRVERATGVAWYETFDGEEGWGGLTLLH